MGVLQRWGGGLSRRKRAALAAQQEAARVAAEQEAARRAAEEAAAAEAARVAAETAQRQAEEAAQRQREEYARQQAEIIARQQAASAAPPVNAQEVLNQAPTPSGPAFQATPIPQATAPAPFPTVNVFSPTVPAPPKPTPFQAGIFQGLTPGSIPPAEIMGVPIPQPANFNIYDPKTGGRPTGALPAVNFFSSLVQTPTPFTNVDPFAPTMGTVQAPAGQTVAFQPTALQYSTVPNIFALRPLGGLV